MGLDVHEWLLVGYDPSVDDSACRDVKREARRVISVEPSVGRSRTGGPQLEGPAMVMVTVMAGSEKT